MAFSRRGFHYLCDNISREMWGISQNETTAGDGAIALSANPDTSDVRGNVYACTSAGGSGTAYFQLGIEYQPQDAPNTGTGKLRNVTEIYFRFRMLWATPTGAGNEGTAKVFSIWRQDETVDETFIIKTQANDAAGYNLVFDTRAGGSTFNLGTSRKIAFDTWIDVLVHLKIDGTSEVWTSIAGGDYMPESVGDYTSYVNFSAFRLGIYDMSWGAASNAGFYLDDFAVSRNSMLEVMPHRYTAGSGIRDVNQTAAGVALCYPANLIQNGNYARFTYDTDIEFGSPASTGWNDLSLTNNSISGWQVTGLTAGTVYYGRFEIASTQSAGAIVYTSQLYKFATHPTEGSNVETIMCYGTCIGQVAPLGDNYEVGRLIDKVQSLSPLYLGYYFMGDLGYEANSHVRLDDDYGDGIGEPPETQDAFQRVFRECLTNIDLYDLTCCGLFNSQPDDHQWINDGDARHKPGGSLANTLANNWSGEQTANNDYGASTTLADLYTAGIAVCEDWWSDHWLDKAVSTEWYQVKKYGKIHVIIIDTRTNRNPDTPTYIGTAQKTWLKARIDDFEASTATTCILMCQDAWGEYPTKNTEGWERIANAEYQEMVDYVYNNVSASKRVFTLVGDDHIGYSFHTDIDSSTNPSPCSAPWVGEMKFSGVSMAYLYSASSLISSLGAKNIWTYPASNISNDADTIRSSGGMLRFAADASAVTALIYMNDESDGSVEHTHTLFGTAQNLDTEIITPAGIASGDSFGSPNIQNDQLIITPTSIPSAGAFGTPTTNPVVRPVPILSAEAFGVTEIPHMAANDTLIAKSNVHDYIPPTTNFATRDRRNGHPVLEFDDTTGESAIFKFLMPNHYGGGDVQVRISFTADTAVTGTGAFTTEFERVGAVQDLDEDSFAASQSSGAVTVSGTSGIPVVATTTHTAGAQMDSVAAGESFRLRITRDVATDTAVGDLQIESIEIREV